MQLSNFLHLSSLNARPDPRLCLCLLRRCSQCDSHHNTDTERLTHNTHSGVLTSPTRHPHLASALGDKDLKTLDTCLQQHCATTVGKTALVSTQRLISDQVLLRMLNTGCPFYNCVCLVRSMTMKSLGIPKRGKS